MRDGRVISSEMTVQRVLDRWPRAVRVFLDRRMACVGCPVAAFETVAQVARVYEADVEGFVQALRRCAAGADDDRPADEVRQSDEVEGWEGAGDGH